MSAPRDRPGRARDPRECPFRAFQGTVTEAWVDYNGHMTDSAYSVACSAANEAFLDALDLSENYQQRTGRTTYTVESRLRYLHEANAGDALNAESVLVRADAKRLLIHTALYGRTGVQDTHGHLLATGEYLFLHINQITGRAEPFDPAHSELIRSVTAAHASWPRPSYLGRGVWEDGPKAD